MQDHQYLLNVAQSFFKLHKHCRWLAVLGFLFVVGPAIAADSIVMASTTSTANSGLLGYLLPAFQKETGIAVKVVAVGTGQAIDSARRGDADVLFVHDKAQEERFVSDGYGLSRQNVMYNDFVLVGPGQDPAKAAGRDIARALRAIAQSRATFISRGDKSGTHSAELRFWAVAGANKAEADYLECGCGMGSALNIAAAKGGYVLTDRGTWGAFRNKNNLAVLVEGDPPLFNQYGVIVVNPQKHPHVKAKAATRFAKWVVSPVGQQLIAEYRVGGQQLFFPNAKP
jgi:tungstate transport system substrate-binding protein